MQQDYDVIILGAGASGLMCAGWLRQHSTLKVAIIEGNARVGAKLKISGGGKCNITNVDVQSHHYLGDRDLLEATFGAFGQQELMAFLDERGLKPVLRKGRYYFCPHSSEEIITLLLRECHGVDVYKEHRIEKVDHDGTQFQVMTDAATFRGQKVVVATGGVSYRSVGATDIGLHIAQHFGHHTIPFSPALAGLTLQKEQFWMKELAGVSCPVRIEVDGHTIEEDMLFAHRGISGPAVLSASLYWHKGSISIDFLPDHDIMTMHRGHHKKISTMLPLPKRFGKLVLEHLGVADVPYAQLDEQGKKILQQLHRYTFSPAGTFGFTKAEVSRGGVDTEMLNHYTLESLEQEGLYFIGEVADVTGELGGYNFQWAFSSAVVVARALCEGLE